LIEGLDNLLEDRRQPGITELRTLVRELLDAPDICGRLIDEQKLLRSRVYRLRFEINDDTRSLVVKRFSPDRAHREQAVIQRWLPRIGLHKSGPPLIGIAAERTGQCTWHVYDDLGDWTLDKHMSDVIRVRAAVELIAQVHTSFAGNALLGECRASGGDLGTYFFRSNLHDAIRSLEFLSPNSVEISTEQHLLKNRLLGHLNNLADEEQHRAEVIEEFSGSETLLHGDLWTTNILVLPSSDRLHVRLIDWDHAGVGPITYDLSTFLLRFPIQDREWILNYYEESISNLNWQLPSTSVLNLLFDTAERSRLANTIVWLANAASESNSDWAFDELAEVDQWFRSLKPILPLG
jgi:hypothetical protein